MGSVNVYNTWPFCGSTKKLATFVVWRRWPIVGGHSPEYCCKVLPVSE
jgi:hypothetical protein